MPDDPFAELTGISSAPKPMRRSQPRTSRPTPPAPATASFMAPAGSRERSAPAAPPAGRSAQAHTFNLDDLQQLATPQVGDTAIGQDDGDIFANFKDMVVDDPADILAAEQGAGEGLRTPGPPAGLAPRTSPQPRRAPPAKQAPAVRASPSSPSYKPTAADHMGRSAQPPSVTAVSPSFLQPAKPAAAAAAEQPARSSGDAPPDYAQIMGGSYGLRMVADGDDSESGSSCATISYIAIRDVGDDAPVPERAQLPAQRPAVSPARSAPSPPPGAQSPADAPVTHMPSLLGSSRARAVSSNGSNPGVPVSRADASPPAPEAPVSMEADLLGLGTEAADGLEATVSATVDEVYDFIQGAAAQAPAQEAGPPGLQDDLEAAIMGGRQPVPRAMQLPSLPARRTTASPSTAGEPREAGDVALERAIQDAEAQRQVLSPRSGQLISDAVQYALNYVEDQVAKKEKVANVTADGLRFARLNACRTAAAVLSKSVSHHVTEARREADKAEASAYKEDIKAEIKAWAFQNGARRQLRNLLVDLDKVLWEGAEWKCRSLADVSSDSGVKHWLKRARLLLHTDKLHGQPETVKLRAELILDEIDKALKGVRA